MRRMNRAQIDGIELAYELRGAGEPVVLIHWGVASAWAEPLLREPGLAESYRLLSYHRAGFGDSSRVTGPISMADHARHCSLLLRRLEIDRAHIVGHSSSAAIALQLALDFPEAVGTMVLMDAARPVPATEMQQEFVRTFVAPAVELYRAGDRVAAVDTFLRGVFGADYREPLEKGLPGAFDRCVEEADAFFAQELPALQAWSLTREDAARVAQPVLCVVGENSASTFPERRELLLSMLPNAEAFDLSGASHLLHLENPQGMAAALAAFFARHSARRSCLTASRRAGWGECFIERPTSEGADGPGSGGFLADRGTRMNPRGRSGPGRSRTSARRFEVGSSRLGPSRRFGYSPAYDGIRDSRRGSSSRPISGARVAPLSPPARSEGRSARNERGEHGARTPRRGRLPQPSAPGSLAVVLAARARVNPTRPPLTAGSGSTIIDGRTQPSAADPRPPEPTSSGLTPSRSRPRRLRRAHDGRGRVSRRLADGRRRARGQARPCSHLPRVR